MPAKRNILKIRSAVLWYFVLSATLYYSVIAQSTSEKVPAQGRVGNIPVTRRRYQGNPGEIRGEYVVSAVLPLKNRRTRRSHAIQTNTFQVAESEKASFNGSSSPTNSSLPKYLYTSEHDPNNKDGQNQRKLSDNRLVLLERLLLNTFLRNSSNKQSLPESQSPDNSSDGDLLFAEQRQLRSLFQPLRRLVPRVQHPRPILGFHGGNFLATPPVEQESFPTLVSDNQIPVWPESFLNDFSAIEIARRPDRGEPALLSIVEDGAILEPAFLSASANTFKKENFRRVIPTPSPSRDLSPPPKNAIRPKEPRCDRLTEEICLEDSDYPSSAIMNTIYSQRHKFNILYAELKERSNQVDGLSRKQEQSYTHDHYFGSDREDDSHPLRPRNYGPEGGFICPSEIYYAKPQRAKNRHGDWKVVINVAEYTQTVRMEKCTGPGQSCNYIQNSLQSTCSQVYGYHRLVVFDKERGLHIDVFKVPTACTCHIKGNRVMFPPSRGSESKREEVHASLNTNPNGPSFGHTLWSILSGRDSIKEELDSFGPQLLDQVRSQASYLHELPQDPKVSHHLSPSEVLKKLLETDKDVTPNLPPQRNFKRPSGRPDLQKVTSPRHPPGDRIRVGETNSGRSNRRRGTKRPLFGMPQPLKQKSSERPSGSSQQLYPEFSEPEKDTSGFLPLVIPSQSGEISDDLLAEERSNINHSVPSNSSNHASVHGRQQDISESASKINFSYHPILEYISVPQ